VVKKTVSALSLHPPPAGDPSSFSVVNVKSAHPKGFPANFPALTFFFFLMLIHKLPPRESVWAPSFCTSDHHFHK